MRCSPTSQAFDGIMVGTVGRQKDKIESLSLLGFQTDLDLSARMDAGVVQLVRPDRWKNNVSSHRKVP